MDYKNPQMETQKKKNRVARDQVHPQKQRETPGTNPCPQGVQSAIDRSALLQLTRLTAMLPNESASYPDDLPTSFACAEKALAECISKCLADVPLQKRSTAYVQSLLRDYRVIVPVRGQNPSVSLQRVHLILQDNYQGSSLCLLFNILLAGWLGLTAKVITID
ncbi:MAG: hypothetical protein KKC03_01185 [Bacteroidetes bacterium]|nr:hypothetical protein [Bacteroidota bacterium]